MEISDEQRQKASDLVKSKWKLVGGCPLCHATNFDLQPTIFQIPEFFRQGAKNTGAVIPVIPYTCTNCGFTILVNALVAGIISPQAKTEKETSKPAAPDQISTPGISAERKDPASG